MSQHAGRCHGDGCLRQAPLACKSCGWARYCSAECQRRDWKSNHKGECCEPSSRPAREQQLMSECREYEQNILDGLKRIQFKYLPVDEETRSEFTAAGMVTTTATGAKVRRYVDPLSMFDYVRTFESIPLDTFTAAQFVEAYIAGLVDKRGDHATTCFEIYDTPTRYMSSYIVILYPPKSVRDLAMSLVKEEKDGESFQFDCMSIGLFVLPALRYMTLTPDGVFKALYLHEWCELLLTNIVAEIERYRLARESEIADAMHREVATCLEAKFEGVSLFNNFGHKHVQLSL